LLTAEYLHSLYAKQYQDYIKAKDTILGEKVSESAYEGLRQVFLLRSSFPLETIQTALDVNEVACLQKKGMKKSFSEAFPSNPDTIDKSAMPGKFSLAHWRKLYRRDGVPFKHRSPKNFLSGITGLVRSLEVGFTKEQLEKGKKTFGK